MPYKRSEEEFVSAVMSANLLTASADDALTEAARRMAERRVGAILVTDGTELTGIMTERDVLRAVGKASIDGTVGDWMTRHPDTAPQSATIGQAAAMMLHGGYRHVPIVDGDHLVGIVSIRDLLRLPSETPSGV
ncbi:MAG TPA: CBS domain-containing protein [Gaiellales bacterium]|jgi:CBS domain-containing protein